MLCLTFEEAAELLPGREPGSLLSVTMIKDYARGKSRVPADVWETLGNLFEAVDQATDEIIADQGEADGGTATLPLDVDVWAIDLPHDSLKRAAFARARLILGPSLIVAVS